ncbi:Uncharacterised protein [Mycobacteroides abscessus subsp. abscessus]|nr:Uncharacterised protein [Mycobacteroides abscessus subsp. abscessus]
MKQSTRVSSTTNCSGTEADPTRVSAPYGTCRKRADIPALSCAGFWAARRFRSATSSWRRRSFAGVICTVSAEAAGGVHSTQASTSTANRM